MIYFGLTLYQPLSDPEPFTEVQEWLTEHGIPMKIAAELPDDLLEDLKVRMENSEYIIGELKDSSTPEQIKLSFDIWIENDKNSEHEVYETSLPVNQSVDIFESIQYTYGTVLDMSNAYLEKGS
ncbi:MAG: hypothetical protein KH452_10105 [Clostridiales bacterium]|nr:hypothetical protein [Clostridiales bacterium]